MCIRDRLMPLSGRAVWSVRATNSKTGQPLIREGEETITFDPVSYTHLRAHETVY